MYLRPFLLLIFLSICTATPSLIAQDFAKVDAYARSVKAPRNHDVEALAQLLTKDCTTEKEKVRSFYVWLAENIKYDITTFENRGDMDQKRAAELQTSEVVLKRGKSICQGYSQLMDDLCKAVGIKSFLVGGRTKTELGKLSRATHAWNVVQADGVWYSLDATFGAGNVDMDAGKYTKDFKEKFFCAAPETMIRTHYPEDPIYQLLPTPITWEEFKKMGKDAAPLAEKKKTEATTEGAQGNLLDAYYALDSIDRFQSAGKRIMQLDPTSNYGIHTLGTYYFQLSKKGVDKFVAAFETFPQGKSAAQTAWKTSQTNTLQEIERNLEQCKALLQQASQSDQYTTLINQLRSNVKQMEQVLSKNRKGLEQMKL